jgi:hypothetical protein
MTRAMRPGTTRFRAWTRERLPITRSALQAVLFEHEQRLHHARHVASTSHCDGGVHCVQAVDMGMAASCVIKSRLAGARLPSNGNGAADVAAGTRGSCPVLAPTGTSDGRPFAAVAARGVFVERRQRPGRTASGPAQPTCFNAWLQRRAAAGAQAPSGVREVRPKRANAVASPGGVPKRRRGRQPPSDAACSKCWSSRASEHTRRLRGSEERRRVCSPLAGDGDGDAKAAGPFSKAAAVLVGHDPSGKQ